MIGFVWLGVIGAAAFAALAALRVPRVLWSMTGAALMLGAAGYAGQGRPGLAGADAGARTGAKETPIELSPALLDLRARLLGKYTADTAYLVAADAMLRAGDRDAAARVMMGGTRAMPGSVVLWTGLGSALAARDPGPPSPAALLAFRRAFQLAPRHPAPPFYLGLAWLEAGDAARARILWRRAIALSPKGASYRRDIATLLMLIERERPPEARR